MLNSLIKRTNFKTVYMEHLASFAFRQAMQICLYGVDNG
ncbi:hypothetical protein BN2475_1030001 [Paraburkholderia ribeironis]|uniref:Uncharacterized protein n=1 Tax=Paraburkholderia ribeironis TaxID=1247936 RepID=A0A1N7SLX4_9BURK|nr:hypothetical protein BN2475_1030001 [Paraburkholderia ribeironis]